MKVSDFITARLVELGIRVVFGVGGANIEDMFAAVQRRRPAIRVALNKHEHAAGTAADAYARLTGGLGVVLATSGGGAMNLVHSVAEARASSVPLLAIVGEPPTELQGIGAFQDTSGRRDAIDAAAIFGAASVWCKRVEHAEQAPRLLSEALDATLGPQPGPAVLLVAKDYQSTDLGVEPPFAPYLQPEPILPDPVKVHCAATLLRVGPVLVIAGEEVARTGAQQELASLVDALDASVAVAPEARDAFDNFSPRFVGVCGAMGSPDVARALEQATTCLVVGTRLPVLARQGLEHLLSDKPLVSLGHKGPFLTPNQGLHLDAGLRQALRALCATIDASLAGPRPRPPARVVSSGVEDGELTSRSALRVIENALPERSVVIVDAGNTGAAAAHALRLPHESRWLLAMGMAGMGYAFGAAIGAAFATGRRCFVLAGDGAFFMNGLDIHTAVEHELPITYVIFNNRAHGMCLVRERLFLAENAGYNSFRRSHLGAGLAAMFPGLVACDCRTTAALAGALTWSARSSGPSLITIELDHVEIPPFAAFEPLARGITTISRGCQDDEH